MNKSPASLDDPRPDATAARGVLPAWLTSLLLHGGLIVLLAVTIRVVPGGVAEEDTRTTGIVLKHVEDAGEYYEGEQDNVEAASESAAAEAASDAVAAALPSANESPLDVPEFLPSVKEGFGPPAGEIGGGGNLELAGDAPGTRNISGGKARTGVFGLSGEGYNFVYVFDASASMSSNEGRPLAAAKRELTASLEHLSRLNQFQIIFYNEDVDVFNPTGVPGKLFFASDENKQAARRWIRSVEARLSTDHLPALLRAVDSGADVIFFLTDGEDPALTAVELSKVTRRNAGRSAIHVVQFGTAAPSPDNWLKSLARQNNGQYKFFNIRRLSPR